jgi:tetratricopeptide (TPR) repeat protein
MKRIKINGLAILLVVAIFLSSCAGLDQMKKLESGVKYTVTPSPLELVGNQVAVGIKVTYPAKFFNKKAVVQATPYIKYDKGSKDLKSVTVQGESVEGNNQIIKNAEGGSLKPDYSDQFEYNNDMMKAELWVKADAWITKKEAKKLALTPIKIADGIIVTPKLVKIDPRPLMASDKYVKVIPDSYSASLLYVINRYDIRPTELKKDEIKKLNDYIVKTSDANSRLKLKNIEISSYASPDGPVPLNTKLSGNRGGAADSYLKKELKKAKITEAEKAELWKVMNTPEDWDGFKELMEKSNIKDKELVLRVLSMYSDPDVREKEIKHMSATFQEIAKEILPQLRRSKYTVSSEKQDFNDQEIVAFFDSKPDTLSLEQLLYGATLVQDLNKKLAFYIQATKKDPNCWRAKNNVGYIYILQGKPADAKPFLDAAKAIKDNDMVKNNLGCVALMTGDLKTAEDLFTSAMGAGEVVSYNLGIINIINGKYDAAIKYFGATQEFNTALAKLLAKQTDASLGILKGLKDPDARASYLLAVAYARQDNKDGVYASLRLAVGKDATWKAYAVKDLEFGKYFADDTFKSIVQ